MFRSAVIVGAIGLLAACGPRESAPGAVAKVSPDRVPAHITMGVRYELISAQSKALNNSSSAIQKRLFNASLSMGDAGGTVHPYLAERLPQLNSDSWRVFPDGRMETTYQLRPNLAWHDLSPLTADDFVFAYTVYSSKAGLAIFESKPQDGIAELVAWDPHTVVIRWRSLYPDAGVLGFGQLDPLPRHLLEPIADLEDGEALAALPFWTREYISSGPYKLDKWEPGTLVALSAFDRHVLGRPRIDRITVRIIPDENTMLTNVLAGNVDVAVDNSLRFEHGQVLKREWAPESRGTVLFQAIQSRNMSFQRRPDLVKPSALLDLRVRRALAHGIDKQSLVEGLFEGERIPATDTIISPNMNYFPELDRAIVKYPYDPRRVEELLSEAGFRRSPDGGWVGGAANERMSFQLMSGSGTRNERERAVIGDGWRRLGFEVSETQLSAAQTTDAQVRATAPGTLTWATLVGEQSLPRYAGSQIGTPANRWRGQNYGGWSNPEFDRLYEQFSSTLERSERDQQVIQMLRLVTEDVATLVFYHDPGVTAFRSPIAGPQTGVPGHMLGWNVYEWSLE